MARGGEEPQDQPHRVDGRVRNAHRRLKLGVQVGLQAQRLRGVQPLHRDAGAGAALDERFEVLEVLVAHGHEQSVVALERAGRDAPQDHVLPDALDARLAVAHGVTGAAVEEPVVTAARPRGHLAAFEDRNSEPSEREIVSQASAGGASTDDQNVRMLSTRHSLFLAIPRGWQFPWHPRIRKNPQPGCMFPTPGFGVATLVTAPPSATLL